MPKSSRKPSPKGKKSPNNAQITVKRSRFLDTFVICFIFFAVIFTFYHVHRYLYFVPKHFNVSEVMKRPNWSQPGPIAKKKIRIPIIMYHYVEYVNDPNDTVKKSLTINPYTFEQELKALREANYTTYFVSDVPNILKSTVKFDPRSVILTFDDGYEDFYTVVLPLLKKYHMKASFYVINNFIGRTGFVNQKQLEAIRDSGLVEIGAHTMDHAYLKGAINPFAQYEIVESKKDLEERLGIQVKTFAYPFGAFSEESVKLVKQASFSAAVSVIPGVDQSEDNLYILYRVRAGRFSAHNIAQLLAELKQ